MTVCGRLLLPSNTTNTLAVWCVKTFIEWCFVFWPSCWDVAVFRFYSSLFSFLVTLCVFVLCSLSWSELSVKKVFFVFWSVSWIKCKTYNQNEHNDKNEWFFVCKLWCSLSNIRKVKICLRSAPVTQPVCLESREAPRSSTVMLQFALEMFLLHHFPGRKERKIKGLTLFSMLCPLFTAAHRNLPDESKLKCLSGQSALIEQFSVTLAFEVKIDC